MSEKKPNKTSQERLDTNERYIQQLDDIKIRVPKGSKAEIQKYKDYLKATDSKISVNQIVIRALMNDAAEHDYDLVIPSGVRDVKSKDDNAATNTERNYDRLPVHIGKGQRAKVQEYAASKGESVNALINRLLAGEIPDYTPYEGN